MNVLIAASLALVQQVAPAREAPAFEVDPGAILEIGLGASSVDIVGSAAASAVRIEGLDGSDRFGIEARPRRIHIVERSDDEAGSTLRIEVPAATPLIVRARTGRVSVSGLTAGADIRGRGDVRILDAGGPVTAHTSGSGRIDVSGSSGVLEIRAGGGDVTIRDHDGPLTVESVFGTVSVSDVRADEVTASSTHGAVTFSGPLRAAGSYVLSSVNGDVSAEITAEEAGLVTLGTVLGTVQSTFAEVSDYEPGERDVFRLGSGTGRLELTSYRGTLHLSER